MSADPAASVEPDDPHQSLKASESDLETGFPHRAAPQSLRERLEGWAESLDLSLPRLAVGAAVVAVLGVVGWRWLAAPAAPPEMTLPMTQQDGPSGTGGTAREDAGGPGSATATDDDGPAATLPAEVVVHVAGAVQAPGVQRLEPAARVVDAVEAAGGATEDADLARVNLAAPVEDGQQVYIPRVGEDPPGPVTVPGNPAGSDVEQDGSAAQPGSSPTRGLVNINTAGIEELETLHGIGPALAQAIVDHRDNHGPFASVEQLTDVRGIGEAKLDGLRDQVTV